MLKEEGVLSVTIISPNAPYRTSLEEFLRQQGGIVVGVGYSDIEAGIKKMPQPYPDVAIMDFRSFENIVAARETWTDTLIICLLDYIGDLDPALSSGANSCILKDGGSSAIGRAVTALTSCRN